MDMIPLQEVGNTPRTDVKFDCQILQNFGYVYTVDKVNEVQSRWQSLTSSKFVCAKVTKGFGKNDFDLLKHHVQWELASLGPVGAKHKGIDYDGIPFIVLATKLLDCQYGTDRHRKKKLSFGAIRPERAPSGRRWPRSSNKECKKINCKAQLLIKDVLKFPGFRIRNMDRAQKAYASKKLRFALEENKNVVGERRFYLMLPHASQHSSHPQFEIMSSSEGPTSPTSRSTTLGGDPAGEMQTDFDMESLPADLPPDSSSTAEPPRKSLKRPYKKGGPSKSSGMRAVQQAGHGGADTLLIDPISQRPVLEDNEILIEVFNTAVNRADILQRNGSYTVPKGASKILGLEASGRVHKIGAKCSSKWKKGDRVMALLNGGGYAEYAAVPEDHLMAIPDHMTFAEAAAIPEVWLTAHQLLNFIGKVSKDEHVLIHAGGSGVGTAAVQLAALAGAKAIVTAGSAEKINRALDLGAIAGINHKEEAFPTIVSGLTDGKGVDLILDCIGSAYWAKNLEALAVDGRWVLYGLMGGANVKGNLLGGLLRKRATLTATLLRPRSDEYKTELIKDFTTNALPLFSPVGDSPARLKPIVDKVFPLDQIQKAHKYVEANKNIGKVVVSVKIDENEKQPEAAVDEVATEAVTDHGEL